MPASTDLDLTLELERIARQFDGDPQLVFLVDPTVPEPLAERTVDRRPRPGSAVEFDVERRGVAHYVVEAHGAWQLRVDNPPRVDEGDTVTVHVA